MPKNPLSEEFATSLSKPSIKRKKRKTPLRGVSRLLTSLTSFIAARPKRFKQVTKISSMLTNIALEPLKDLYGALAEAGLYKVAYQ
ncbi:hypothetical protein SAMN02927921_03993 [Sinomicrobium oceani]|uniref:Uncharacterized protein n=1 Tax=Sinomicrobium oceani TaxID=1150368 RepID=A0A1K1RUH4_9FLAO|nr:hypothetical protein [Sinomicrobium oceani]SFW75476.1 hypothetical protein SAMN02927921_03993 [Sinomicrobium oceani]